MTQSGAKGVRTLSRGATLNCREVAALPGAPAPPEGAHSPPPSLSLSPARLPLQPPKPAAFPEDIWCQYKDGFSSHAARLGLAAAARPRTARRSGSSAAPAERSPLAPRVRAGGASGAGAGDPGGPTPRPAAPAAPHLPRRGPAPPPPARSAARPPPAARSNSARLAARPRRPPGAAATRPPWPAPPGPPPCARRPPRPGGAADPGIQRRGAGGARGPSPRRLRGHASPPTSLPGTTQLPGHVHAKVGEAVDGGGREEKAEPPWSFSWRVGLFLYRGVYLFIYYFWGLILPPPHLPARTHQVGATSCAWGWGTLHWEEGQGTLTGPLSKATKVLLVPILKPKAG